MSKVIPDPQIQSLKAMRAGDIAFAPGGTITVGKQSIAFAQPLAPKAIAPPAPVPATVAPVATPTETPVVGVAFAETLSQNASQSVSLTAVPTQEPLTAMPSEAPTVGVATSTSVV